MNKKNLYLFLALLLPGLVFVFLKYFGKNEFDIPVYFTKGVDDSLACGAPLREQYHISDSAFANLKCNNCGVTLIVEGSHESDEKYLSALENNGLISGFRVIFLKNILPGDEGERFRRCVVFLRRPWNA